MGYGGISATSSNVYPARGQGLNTDTHEGAQQLANADAHASVRGRYVLAGTTYSRSSQDKVQALHNPIKRRELQLQPCGHRVCFVILLNKPVHQHDPSVRSFGLRLMWRSAPTSTAKLAVELALLIH